MEWTPKQSDLDWQRNTLAMIKDGGTWISPAMMQVYTVNHTDKTLTMTVGACDENFLKVKRVCEAIGWTVKTSAMIANPGDN